MSEILHYGNTPMNKTMYHEDRKILDREMLCAILDQSSTCCVGLHDTPYPYVVPMNFGYTWDKEEGLVIYLHMAQRGHRLSLLAQDPHVGITVYTFYDRRGKKNFRGEAHDYRSVMVFGVAEEITEEADALMALNQVCLHTGRKGIKQIPPSERPRMRLFRVRAQEVIGKAQYPIAAVDEVPIPVFED